MPKEIIDKRREARLLDAAAGGGGAAGALQRKGTEALSLLYGAGVARRNAALERRPVTRVGAPVISVGNITTGGTGKTPVCLYLANLLQQMNVRVGIATRGYKRKERNPALITPEASTASWQQIGDESRLYARRNYCVAVDPDRASGAMRLADDLRCGGILLDDGFQFLTLHKDLNICVFDAANPFGHGRLLPSGLLREPLSALERADIFWFTKVNQRTQNNVGEARNFLNKLFPRTPVILSDHKPTGIIALNDENNPDISLETVKNKFLCALSGLGSPESFESTVESLTSAPVLAYRFSDHHPFTLEEIREVEATALARGCEAVITSEKDAVRLPDSHAFTLPWYELRIGMDIIEGRDILDDYLFRLFPAGSHTHHNSSH